MCYMQDGLVNDGLTDVYNDCHMVCSALINNVK